MSLVSVWNNDGSNVSTLEKKTLKIYHVLDDLNYDILRIYAEIWKKIPPSKKNSTRWLSEELGESKDTIHSQIETLGKSYKSCRSVRHE